MQRYEIKLIPEEKLELEYRTYEHQGMLIAIDPVRANGKEYSEEFYSRLIATYLEKYRELQECIYKILKNHGIKNVVAKNYEYVITDGVLMIWG
jgi:hypothetical protein